MRKIKSFGGRDQVNHVSQGSLASVVILTESGRRERGRDQESRVFQGVADSLVMLMGRQWEGEGSSQSRVSWRGLVGGADGERAGIKTVTSFRAWRPT